MKPIVVIPTYNRAQMVCDCVRSVLATNYPELEVIVVDDCSTGNCQEIVARYDGRFRCIRHDRNKGAFQARLTAIRSA